MLTLSEAIRLGAMLHPQGFGTYQDADGHTCALGAARDAGYVLHRIEDAGKDARMVIDPFLARVNSLPCPVCGHVAFLPVHVAFLPVATVPHLNDDHRWSREQIADFVEAQEQEFEGQQALTDSTDAVHGTTEHAQPVLATRAS